MFSFRVAALTLTLTTGLITAGCGAGASLSPTGPSIGPSSSSAVTSDLVAFASETSAEPAKDGHGRVDADHGHRDDKNKEDDKGKDGDKGKEGDHDNGVEANGRITSITAATRILVIGTQQVSVPATATIRHGSQVLTFADLKVGDHVEVKGAFTTTTGLVASEVKVEGEGDDHDDAEDGDLNEAEVSGAVSARGGTCPAALTFSVGTTKVTTTATTVFRRTTCEAVVNAAVVEVKGTRQTDGSIVATRVSLED